jgi:glutamine synthetase
MAASNGDALKTSSLPTRKAKKVGDQVASVMEMIDSGKVKMVDFKFIDLPGTLQHVSIPATKLDMDKFIEGHGFDGSSIRGFSAINESDMLLVPDAGSAIMDPVYRIPTLSMVCDVLDPVSRERFERDPRFVASKAESYLKETGIADTAFFGPELEFFVFDSVRFDQNQYSGYYYLDSDGA